MDKTTNICKILSCNFAKPSNVIIGITKKDQPGEVCFLTCKVLEKVNHFTTVMLFDDAMSYCGHMV